MTYKHKLLCCKRASLVDCTLSSMPFCLRCFTYLNLLQSDLVCPNSD